MIYRNTLAVFAALCMATTSALGQAGDRKDKGGTVQKNLFPQLKPPPAPVLSPEKAIKSFTLPEGFDVQIVAAEPLVDTPVAMEIGPDGRMWVVEMRGYMRDPDATGEHEKIGRIKVLEDTNGDGRMDKMTVFKDGLFLPRAIALVRGGVLVAEPPRLLFFEDTNGDDKADKHTVVATDYAIACDPARGLSANPEHAANGLMWGLDNWIYSANHTVRFRNTNGEWQREQTIKRGQWGISMDNLGRLFYNSNSDMLRGDLIASEYLDRNPFSRQRGGVAVRVAKTQETWPGRINLGVNRAYRKGTLRSDGPLEGRLSRYTAACGPVIYRGNNFPKNYLGNSFVCEPSGNFIRRNQHIEINGNLAVENAESGTEWLTSTDERFRPVNLYNGPSGGLYIVDMYRGLVQHRIYLTSYLRAQAESRGLEKDIDKGRIYRVVYKGASKSLQNLAKASGKQLVAALSSENGWTRDTAQRLLVESSEDVNADLAKLATDGNHALGRVHALWTLEGRAAISPAVVLDALSDRDRGVRMAAARLAEPWLKLPGSDAIIDQLVLNTGADDITELRQMVLSLGAHGNILTHMGIRSALYNHADKPYIMDAALSGLAGEELEFLELLLAERRWRTAEHRADVIEALSDSIFREGRPSRVGKLIYSTYGRRIQDWQRLAILRGVARNKSKGKPVYFDKKPKMLTVLQKSKNAEEAKLAKSIDKLFLWNGKPGVKPLPPLRPLTDAEQAQFTQGKQLYTFTCATCHQGHGRGQAGVAPPLVDSDWVLKSDDRLVRIVLQGVAGPITVNGQKHDLEMPALLGFNDDQVASILTYIRREWDHRGEPVNASTVKAIRAATADRVDPWTEPELLKLK